MDQDLYIAFIEKCVGRTIDEAVTMALSGEEVVDAMWPLNDRFKPKFHQIASLPYDAHYEKEADDAIEALVFKDDNWSSVSGQAWRVLLERQQQAIVFFQLQADEPFVPIPEDLSPVHYPAAAWLFVLRGWTLPFPVADRSGLATPPNTPKSNLTSH